MKILILLQPYCNNFQKLYKTMFKVHSKINKINPRVSSLVSGTKISIFAFSFTDLICSGLLREKSKFAFRIRDTINLWCSICPCTITLMSNFLYISAFL